jgi:tetratricopeptide (TPR) repeat protein
MVSSHGNQGMCLWKLGQLEEALECYNTSIRILPIIYDAPHHDRAVTQFNRARILLELGRMDECLDACRDVEKTLSDKTVRSEQRSLDLEKRYLEFKKQLPKKP